LQIHRETNDERMFIGVKFKRMISCIQVAFLRSGQMYPDLNAAGTTPADRDALSKRHRKGTSSAEHSLRSQVGIGSEAHCLFGRERTAAATLSCVTSWKPEKELSWDANTIDDTLYLRALKSWRYGQLYLAHGTETKK